MTTSSSIGQKLWNYSNVLRDAGLSYGDYLEQLTYLLFLKMMHERSQPPYTLLPGLRRRRPFRKGSTGPACWNGTAMSWKLTTAIPLKRSRGRAAPSASYSARLKTRSRSRPC